MVIALEADARESLHHLDMAQARVHPTYLNLRRGHNADTKNKTIYIGDNNTRPRTRDWTEVMWEISRHTFVVRNKSELSHFTTVTHMAQCIKIRRHQKNSLRREVWMLVINAVHEDIWWVIQPKQKKTEFKPSHKYIASRSNTGKSYDRLSPNAKRWNTPTHDTRYCPRSMPQLCRTRAVHPKYIQIYRELCRAGNCTSAKWQ